MTFSTSYQKAYLGLPEQLVKQYGYLNFDNHCYLRIALDNTLSAKWDTKIARPAYKHLDPEQLDNVLSLLRQYQMNKNLLIQHNRISLDYRKAWKNKN